MYALRSDNNLCNKIFKLALAFKSDFFVQVVYELPTSNQWCFDVKWCPRNPAVISSSSFDGHVTVYSLMGGGHPIHQSNKVFIELTHLKKKFL